MITTPSAIIEQANVSSTRRSGRSRYVALPTACASVFCGIALFALPATSAQPLPQAYWAFDQNGNDLSGNNRHASLLNGAAVDTGTSFVGAGSLGGEGPGGTLDGAAPPANDYARSDGAGTGLAWTGISGSNPRSISLWFKAPAAQSAANPVLVSWGSTANGTRFELRFDRSGGTGGGVGFPAECLRVEIAGNYICTTNGGYLDDQWHHVLATFPGGSSAADYNNMAFMLDGKVVGHTPTNAAVGINSGTADPVFIGHGIMNGADRPLIGHIDDLGVYGIELSPVDAALLHGLGRIRRIGLDQLDEAQALWSEPLGTTALIAGKSWRKVSGLSGAIGDWGGSWDLNDAFIVLDDSGTGISLASVSGLVWQGGAPGAEADLFEEANWLDMATGANPFAGAVDPNQSVSADLSITNGLPGGNSGAVGNLQLGGRSFVLSGGVLRFDTSGINGIRDDATTGDDTNRSTVFVNGGTLVAQFLGEIALTLGGDGLVTLNGAGNPLNASSVNFLTNTCSLVFSNKSPAQIVADYLVSLSVLGSPAVVGLDPQSPEYGDNLLLTPAGAGCIAQALLGSDTDGDDLPDAWEYQYFGNLDQPTTGDPDLDTLTNFDEFQRGTNPAESDTDHDGLNDAVESNTGTWAGPANTGTDPTKADTDQDGLPDGAENNTGVFASATQTGTSPLNPNTDGDRFTDGAEVARGTDPNSSSSQPNLPNVILIMADDLGVGELGCYGQTKILTPNIDRLAADGMKFTHFYSPSAVCAPTRCQLLTGKHAGRAYIRNNGEVGNGYQRPLHAGAFTLGHLMRNAGYLTACIGKWGLGGPGTTGEPNLQGFDHFFGYLGQVQAHHYYASRLWRNTGKAYYSPTLATAENGTLDIPGANNETGFDNLSLSLANKSNNGNVHSHDAMTREALNWISAHTNQAFFLYLAYTIPHVSIQPPAHIDDLTDPDGLVFDNAIRTCVDEFYPTNPATGLRPFGAPISHPGSGHYSATPDKRHEYAAMISAMDRDIGRIRALLRDSGLDTNTLVIFTSDNGVSFVGEVDYPFFNSNASLRGYKGNLYEGGIRAPFIATWPASIPQGATSSLVGALDDVMPTLADLTSTAHPPDITGRSILPTFLGQSPACQPPRKFVYFEFQESGSWTRALRRGDWKLRRSIGTSGAAYTYALYNLATDPAEATNVASANPELVAELDRAMDGDHVPSQFFFRPTDELPARSGVTLSYGNLGLRLNGTGHGIVPIPQDVSNSVSFKLRIQNTGGATANGTFLFGAGSQPADLVKVALDLTAREYRISHAAQSVTAPISVVFNQNTVFELAIRWDSLSGDVTLEHGTNRFSLSLSSPPTVVDHIGYAVDNSQTDFEPAKVCFKTPPLGRIDWSRSCSRFTLQYHRPAELPGFYLAQQSADLVAWSPALIRREQPRTTFGNIQTVTVEIPPPNTPNLFYRIEYSESGAAGVYENARATE